ncbi:MAG: hypothetical protein QHJ34_05355 [bacterium]|nr:hypothetical protein [candidate division KSB1 bacterium]MDH7559644.1 hypothetical protein [bacterium]
MGKLRSLLRRYRIVGVVFLLALLLWLYVKTEGYYDWVFEAPVRLEGVTAGLVVANDPPQVAKVRLRGQGRAFIALRIGGDLAVFVDANRGRGSHRITIGTDNVSLPHYGRKVEAVEVLSPKEVVLVLEPKVQRSVAVESRLEVQPLNGYTVVGGVHVGPESVVVSGPASLVREVVGRWPTERRELNRVSRDVRIRLPLEQPRVDKLTLSRREVVAFADVQKLMERVLHDIPVEARNVPAGYKAFVVPPKLSLTLEGGVDLLTKVTAEQIVAYVEWRQPTSPEQIDLPAVIETPEGVTWRDVTPPRFKVVLER